MIPKYPQPTRLAPIQNSNHQTLTLISGCQPKNNGTQKWMVYSGKLIKMDDLGVPLFLETPILKQ